MTPRQDILKEYFRLVDLYHAADLLFLEHENVEDEDTFHFYWLKVTKAHNHMQDYQHKHNITRQELTESTQGIRCSSVNEAVKVGGELLDRAHPPPPKPPECRLIKNGKWINKGEYK